MNGSEIAREVGRQIVNWMLIIFWSAIVIGILIGLYFLDRYRWGGCK